MKLDDWNDIRLYYPVGAAQCFVLVEDEQRERWRFLAYWDYDKNRFYTINEETGDKVEHTNVIAWTYLPGYNWKRCDDDEL